MMKVCSQAFASKFNLKLLKSRLAEPTEVICESTTNVLACKKPSGYLVNYAFVRDSARLGAPAPKKAELLKKDQAWLAQTTMTLTCLGSFSPLIIITVAPPMLTPNRPILESCPFLVKRNYGS